MESIILHPAESSNISQPAMFTNNCRYYSLPYNSEKKSGEDKYPACTIPLQNRKQDSEDRLY